MLSRKTNVREDTMAMVKPLDVRLKAYAMLCCNFLKLPVALV